MPGRRVGTREFSIDLTGTDTSEDGVLMLRHTESTSGMGIETIGHIQELVVIVNNLVTGATVEVDLLKEGKENNLDSDDSWHLNVGEVTAAGIADPLIVYGAGVRVRFISGATSGTLTGQVNYLY